MEALNIALTGTLTDRCPDCMHPLLHSILMSANDSLPDGSRDRVWIYACRALGTKDRSSASIARVCADSALKAADDAVRVHASAALDAAGLPSEAAKLRALPPVVDARSADSADSAAGGAARSAARSADSAADSAYSAYSAAYSAARSARSAADSSADSARSAAYSAADSAAYSAADSAARSARSAAYSAAYSARSARSAADSAADSAAHSAYTLARLEALLPGDAT